jgi:ABC-type lipoprotein release transport system permease subunit
LALPFQYNWRNLLVRKLSTSLTFTVVVIVVLVLVVLLSFAEGINASLAASGSPYNVIVLKPGADAESMSVITMNEFTPVEQTPGVARNSDNRPLISRELSVQTSIPRRGPEGVLANVAVRGVDDMAFDVHDAVKLIEGVRMVPGKHQAIVGKAAAERYRNLEIGGRVLLGRDANREYEVVGVFEAGGSAFESEIWVSRTDLSDSYKRNVYSIGILRLENPSRADEAIEYIKGPTVALKPLREIEYYGQLAEQARQIAGLTMILISIMAVGAMFAVANTMFAAVDGRKREIAMLRTIGFSRRSIILSFVIESLIVCVSACVVGFLFSLPLSGYRQDFLSQSTWTVLAYELRMTPRIFAAGLVLSVVVGVIGSIAPAMRAARIQIIDALRKA